MDYKELKNRIFYSKAMRALHSKESPIRGYSDAGAYARNIQRYTDTLALDNDLDSDYCSILALADVIGIPPYGEEGQLALKELLGNAYSKVDVSVAKLQEIAGEQIPEQLKKDLEDLEFHNGIMSNEATIVQIVKNTLEAISLMTKEEYEKMGGASLATSVFAGVKKDGTGRVQPGAFLNRLTAAVIGRKKQPDQERKGKVKEEFKKRMLDSISDKEKSIENIIGE